MAVDLNNLYGTVRDEWTRAYGSRPLVFDPTTAYNRSVAGNVANLGQLYGMAGNINQFMNAQALGNLEANLPGFTGAQAQSMANIGDWQRGKVGGDVLALLGQQGAERGISTGQALGQSGNANAAYLRALGLTSLDLQKQAEGALTAAVGRTPTVAPVDLAPWLTTGQDQLAAEQAANFYASMPDPKAAAEAALAAARSLGGEGGGGGPSGWPMSGRMPLTYHIPGAAGGGRGEGPGYWALG